MANAFVIVCQLDRNDTPHAVPQKQKQKVAIGPLLDQLHKQHVADRLACLAANILPHVKIVSRASCHGLLVGFLRILCNGLCDERRFHAAENNHTCTSFLSEGLTLSHYNQCLRRVGVVMHAMQMIDNKECMRLPEKKEERHLVTW